MRIFYKYILPFLVLLVLAENINAKDSKSFFTPGHEIKIGVGAYPFDNVTLNYMFSGMDLNSDPSIFNSFNSLFTWCDNDSHMNLGDKLYNGGMYKSPTKITGAFSIIYSYRFQKWFELSAAITYSGSSTSYFSNNTDEKIDVRNLNQLTALPIARFVWFRTAYVNMYSSLGLGLGVCFENTNGEKHEELALAFHVNPIGIAVGRRVYGFAELSFGSMGTLIAGIGIKFGNY